PDLRPVVVIDPGHGGIDNGTQSNGEMEKNLVLGFALALRDRIEKAGKYRVVMTRTDDTFIPLADRVKVARNQSAALFVSIHADALPRREGDAQGATIYTLADKASDTEAERLAIAGPAIERKPYFGHSASFITAPEVFEIAEDSALSRVEVCRGILCVPPRSSGLFRRHI